MMDDAHLIDTSTPPHTKPLPPLSPAFISADDAAYWAHEQIGNRRDREYGGAILKHGNRYFATIPIPGQASTFTFNDIFSVEDDGKFILPAGYSCEAIYHSHPANYAGFEGMDLTLDEQTLLLSFFSPADIILMIRFRNVVGAHYLSGPDGSLLKYVASGSLKELAFLNLLETDVDAWNMNLQEGPIPKLAEEGELSVLVANAVWGGVRGRVDKDWQMGTSLVSEHLLQPFFSSVFPRRDIEKLLPEGTAALTQPIFGYVLKAIDKEEYIAPVPAWEREQLVPPAALFMKRAGGGARLPSNFRIESIYCRMKPKESWQHSNFFTPSLLAATCR